MSEYRSLFDARGARYNHANRLFPEARAEEAARLLDHLCLQDGVRWLDVGAGGGFLAGRAALDRRTVPLGCDASPVFLSEAQGYALRAVADYERLPFRAGAFGAAGCLAVLHHAEAPGAVISEMLRVTAPGGRIAIGDVAAGSRAARLLERLRRRAHGPGSRRPFLPSRRGWRVSWRRPAAARCARRRSRSRGGSPPVSTRWRFCRELFGLRPETRDTELGAALNGLGLQASRGGWRIPWDLVLGSASVGA